MTISGKAKLAGVAGWPIGHSLSPALHGFWIAEHKIDAAYVPFAIRPEDFAEAFAALPKLGFRGINVTLPHKEAAFGLTTGHDAAALATGAVNTVVFEDGRALGSNTDVIGFSKNLRAHVSSVEGKTALVLGAGGSARAVIGALKTLGVAKIVLVNRTAAKAEALATFFGGVDVGSWSQIDARVAGADILVNTTSLGMQGELPLEIDLSSMRPGSAVADIVYRPLETPLLAQAKRRGLTAVDGLGMLMHQAGPGFLAWFGVEPKVTPALRAHLVALLGGR